jgi:hypothetical protein
VGGDPLVTVTLLFGELLSGRITDTLDATDCSWSITANDAGTIDSVSVPAAEVRAKDLRHAAPGARSYLAVDVDGQIQEAGPIWSRSWDDKGQTLSLAAAGLWSLFDHRKVYSAAAQLKDAAVTVTGGDLRTLARGLLVQSMVFRGGNLPLVLPDPLAGDLSETYPGWALTTLGDALRDFTQRETGAPDMRFRPRYTADRTGIQWVFEAGTNDAPLLVQTGDDWYFDLTVPRSPVLNVSTDEDATAMAEQAWVTGNGTEAGTLIAGSYDGALLDAGYPLLEVEEARSSVEDQATLNAFAANLRDRSARPVEVWQVEVQASAAAEILPGHRARVVVGADHPWLPEGEHQMRVKSKSGGLGTSMSLDLYAVSSAVL